FYFEGAGREPDIVVAGKALAGGLPGAVVSADAVIDTRARAVGWRSTHTDHPLIAAAIGAAIGEFERRDPAARVAAFGDIVETTIPSAVRRGRAAMWCIEWPDESSTAAAFSMLLENRVVVSFSGRYVRLLPSLVMKPSALADVCRTIARVHDRTT
ncbi:MAG: aminotransferase class III-fold pyridoxal phosphate-dependent enzyme, partial [Proteobacteria bacterium]